MSNFVVMVGFPGCGKSTFSKELATQGYIIHSSDAIRAELDMFDLSLTGQVFDIMNNRVCASLEEGLDVVYDATNLQRKNRANILDRISKYNCRKICYLFLVPISVCMERNSHRTGVACVPEHAYKNMMKSYNVPMLSEGFDEIIPICYDGDIDFDYDFDNLNDFSQENPHHTLSLGEHMQKAYEYVVKRTDNEIVREATKYHDIGKIYTKSYKDKNGNISEIAHYYGHENYGSYLYLILWLKRQNMPFEKALSIAQLINWHMKPHISWKMSDKAKARDMRFLDTELLENIMLLHEADMYAH